VSALLGASADKVRRSGLPSLPETARLASLGDSEAGLMFGRRTERSAKAFREERSSKGRLLASSAEPGADKSRLITTCLPACCSYAVSRCDDTSLLSALRNWLGSGLLNSCRVTIEGPRFQGAVSERDAPCWLGKRLQISLSQTVWLYMFLAWRFLKWITFHRSRWWPP
jgi:hypothetical protein